MTNKPVLLYFDVLQFHPGALRDAEEAFEMRRAAEPGLESAEDRRACQVLMAPLGYRVDAARMDALPGLRVIASSTLQTPHIDLEAAAARGIGVASLAGEQEFMNSITGTAEFTWGLITAITRSLPWAVKAALDGPWGGRVWGRRSPRMLSKMTLGIVGLGRLGRLVAGYGLAFGMEVVHYSPHSRDPRFRACASLEELAESSDVVSLHAKHAPGIPHLIEPSFFRAMRPGSYFVNTARGELVDEAALLEALVSGPLAGAALDVLDGMHDPEFPGRLDTHPLVRHARAHQNLILTPYYAGATRDAWRATQSRTVQLANQQYHLQENQKCTPS